MRDYVLLYINGRREIVRGDRLFQSLSDFLRYDRQLIGTKVVCAEGDCGSCCVLLGQPAGDSLIYRNVTSCIQYLFQLDGVHIVTIEGLKRDGRLSCVQESMVTCQGSQCGFCTPGFVVSLHAMLETRPKLCEPDLRLGLSGNLCRCTGYESILKAGMEADVADHTRLNDLYPPAPILADLTPTVSQAVRVEHEQRLFFKPVTLQQAIDFKAANPTCLLIAGGTDLGVVMNKGKLTPTLIMSIAGLPLREMALKDGVLSIGSLVTLAEFETVCQEHLPEMSRLLQRHGSPPIRNAGTVAGNIANGSPIGDTMPGLFVLNAEVELTGKTGARRVNINDFYTGYRQTVMAGDELITAVHVPLPAAGEKYRIYKISKRYDMDISTFSAAFWMQTDGETITVVRIAYGGVGPVIQRLRKTESLLTGQSLTHDLIDRAAAAVRDEITPISDVRGAKDYRLALGENVLRKFFAEHSPSPGTPGEGGVRVVPGGPDNLPSRQNPHSAPSRNNGRGTDNGNGREP